MIDLEVAARVLFEAHRDTLDLANTTEWKDLSVGSRQRYRNVVGLLLTNLHISYNASGATNVDHP